MLANLFHYINVSFKGICVGGSMAVPGVSGGSMAMILGIYDKLISAVGSFHKGVKRNILFLGMFCIGGFFGLWLFAKPLTMLIEQYPMPTLYFFMGAVAGGLPLMFKNAQVKVISCKAIVYPVLGFLFVFLISLLPEGYFVAGGKQGFTLWLMLLFAGLVSAAALVLPGISVSYVLLLLGMYHETMNAVHELLIAYLFPLGTGLIVGILLITKLLEKAMKHHPQPTYLIIIGFVFGSVLELFPGFPKGYQIPISLIAFLGGSLCVWQLSKTA